MYRKHRCFFRLRHRHRHPAGYLFHCQRCDNENLYPYYFIRLNNYWKEDRQ